MEWQDGVWGRGHKGGVLRGAARERSASLPAACRHRREGPCADQEGCLPRAKQPAGCTQHSPAFGPGQYFAAAAWAKSDVRWGSKLFCLLSLPKRQLFQKSLICNAPFILYCVLKINVWGYCKSSTALWADLIITSPLFCSHLFFHVDLNHTGILPSYIHLEKAVIFSIQFSLKEQGMSSLSQSLFLNFDIFSTQVFTSSFEGHV